MERYRDAIKCFERCNSPGNMCTHLSTGQYVANFDDDDVYAPNYLSAMVESMKLQDLACEMGW